MLHHWTTRSLTSSISIHTRIDVNSLRQVQSFRELGTFTLPIAITSVDIHQYLTSLITKSFGQSLQTQKSFHTLWDSFRLFRKVKVYLSSSSTISALNSREALLTGGPIPVWKWAKPTSSYGRKTGFWEVEVGRAIEDGEWAAGKELLILVKGVSEEKRRT